jgi:PAS domain S-box-containing protein
MIKDHAPLLPLEAGKTDSSTDEAMQTAHWLSVTLYSIGDAVIATDAGSRVTFMNPVAETLTGWSREAAAGQPLDTVFQIVNQETRETVESPVAKALREGVVVGLANHTLLIARDGSERPIDDSAAPIRDVAGEVAGVVLVFRDITERYEHEQALAQSLDYAEKILATLHHPFLILDQSLKVVSANIAFYETFGTSEADVSGRLVYDIGDGHWGIPHLRSLFDELLREDREFKGFEVDADFPRIGARVMRLNARQVHGVRDYSKLILLAFEDVTAGREAAKQIENSEQRYRRLFESARDGILILDSPSMVIVDANPYMSELLGYSKEELCGKHLWEIGLFQDKFESEAAIQTLREKGYVRYEDLPLESEEGVVREVEFICNVYQEGDQQVAQCNIRDITDRKHMERQIHDQARALADAARRKDEFLAMLSHELRNPMAPIFSALHLLGRQNGESELHREARSVVGRQMRHLKRLVDDLLEISRISTGRIRLQPERVEVNALVRFAAERIEPGIRRRQQTLSISECDESLWLVADATRLEQVLANLLENASKYTDAGGSIWLSVDSEAGHAVIRVRDDGIGVSQELLPHLFDLFTQADKSLDRSDGGLGIGLALVKSLVELHRGTVKAHSNGAGRGSEFTVRLPLESGLSALPHEESAAASEVVTAGLSILVVDDNQDAAKMSAILLRSWGHDVRVAHDGLEALERATRFLPQVVLLDIGLPNMDGYEVARNLRQDPRLQNLTIAAITGYGQDEDRTRSRDAGIDHHLVKPVEVSDLKSLLADIQTAVP